MYLAVMSGDEVVELTSQHLAVEHYVPLPVPRKEVSVTEPCELLVDGRGLSRDDMRQEVQRLNRLFQQASDRWGEQRDRPLRPAVEPVYLLFKAHLADALYRAELFFAEDMQWADEALDVQWAAGLLEGEVSWERGVWEGEELELPLTTGTVSRVVNGVTILNHDDADAGHDNWFEVSGIDILGDRPAPLRLEYRNTAGTTLGTLLVGQNAFSDPATLLPIFEAEDATAGPLVDVSEHPGTSSASGGDYQSITFSIADTDGTDGDQVWYRWTFDSTFLQAARGNWFRFLARFQSAPPADVQGRFRVAVGGVGTLWQGDWQPLLTDERIQAFGVAQLPPILSGLPPGAMQSHILYFDLQTTSESDVTVDLDFVQVTPLDGWRRYEAIESGVFDGEWLADDGLRNQVYVHGSTIDFDARNNFIAYGQPFLLRRRDQRFHILMQSPTGEADIGWSLSVRAFYRPRRSTL